MCVTVLSTEAVTTIEENAATVQRILEDYNRMHTVPQQRKDMNYKFPEGLFNNEVDLLGSQEAYLNILTEFDNPADFTLLFDQVEADPMRPNNMFQDLSMDIFDWLLFSWLLHIVPLPHAKLQLILVGITTFNYYYTTKLNPLTTKAILMPTRSGKSHHFS